MLRSRFRVPEREPRSLGVIDREVEWTDDRSGMLRQTAACDREVEEVKNPCRVLTCDVGRPAAACSCRLILIRTSDRFSAYKSLVRLDTPALRA